MRRAVVTATRRSRTTSDSNSSPVSLRSRSNPSASTCNAAVVSDGSTRCRCGVVRRLRDERRWTLKAGCSLRIMSRSSASSSSTTNRGSARRSCCGHPPVTSSSSTSRRSLRPKADAIGRARRSGEQEPAGLSAGIGVAAHVIPDPRVGLPFIDEPRPRTREEQPRVDLRRLTGIRIDIQPNHRRRPLRRRLGLATCFGPLDQHRSR